MFIQIFCIMQVVLAKNTESNLKKSRHKYMQEPILMPSDLDYSSLFTHGYKPPQLTDELLAVMHDEHTDSKFDKTKNDTPTSVNFKKWFEDVMSNAKPSVTLNESKSNCTNRKELTDIMNYLSVLNDNINELKDIVKSKNNAFLVMRVPDRPKHRRRRDVNTTDINIDVKTVNKTDNGRRFLSVVQTPNDIKSKLLLYLDEAFNEIDRKIEPLNVLKKSYYGNNNFKIGYIVANIDTLEVNLKKLRDEMEKNKHLWDDVKVLDLFDRLKAADSVLSSLLESLKIYVNLKNVN